MCRSRFYNLLFPRSPTSTLFPYSRSSDLLAHRGRGAVVAQRLQDRGQVPVPLGRGRERDRPLDRDAGRAQVADAVLRDRKSTRLNSSHSSISYAVFCLKKKIHNLTNRENS